MLRKCKFNEQVIKYLKIETNQHILAGTSKVLLNCSYNLLRHSADNLCSYFTGTKSFTKESIVSHFAAWETQIKGKSSIQRHREQPKSNYKIQLRTLNQISHYLKVIKEISVCLIVLLRIRTEIIDLKGENLTKTVQDFMGPKPQSRSQGVFPSFFSHPLNALLHGPWWWGLSRPSCRSFLTDTCILSLLVSLSRPECSRLQLVSGSSALLLCTQT